MKYRLLFALLAIALNAFAQIKTGGILPDGILLRSFTATGNSSGHIGDMTLQNAGNAAKNVDIPAALIPSEGKRQGFAVPEPTRASIPGNGTVTVPIRGYCTDHDLPAPAPGAALPATDTWDPRSPLVNTVRQIIQSTAGLQESGQIVTPFSGDPERERETVIQQTVWVASAGPDKPYTAADFCARAKQQYQTFTGKPGEGLPPAFTYGIAQIWDAATKVGRATGILALLPPALPPVAARLTDAPPSANPAVTQTAKATGTGRTTGHVADLAISNPTDQPVIVQFGAPNVPPGAGMPPGNALYIPSGGQYQPYVIPYLPQVPVAPGETKVIPVEGFCTDVRMPPVPAGEAMPPVSSWITAAPPQPLSAAGTAASGIVTVPTRSGLSLDDAITLLSNTKPKPKPEPGLPSPGHTTLSVPADCPDGLLAPLPTIPGTNTLIPTPVNPDQYPALGVPLLLDAISRIALAYDELKPKGAIATPFSGNPDKEREAVIQQTFWLYSAALRGEPYEKQDFRGNTIRQFEQNTGKTFDQIPPPQQEKLDKGVDDFWDSFAAVGAEAKILPKTPEPPKPAPAIQSFFNDYTPKTPGQSNAQPPVLTDNKPVPIQAQDKRPGQKNRNNQKQCECGTVTVKIVAADYDEQNRSSKPGTGKDASETAQTGTGLPDYPIKLEKENVPDQGTQIIAVYVSSINCPCVDLAHEDVVNALKRLEEANKKKVGSSSRETDLGELEAQLKALKEKARKSKSDEKKIEELEAKITAIREALKAIDEAKKKAKSSDCPVFHDADSPAKKENERKKPPKLELDNKDGKIKGADWRKDSNDADCYTFTLKKEKNKPMEFKFTLSFYCQGDDCKPVQCTRTFVVQVTK
ncbi:MAG: hypothetical protein L6Q97_15360 [Thermoanaerobaculia bacterium]|nr:hypothetical protein [Thermoanaerobaculia bacterium]